MKPYKKETVRLDIRKYVCHEPITATPSVQPFADTDKKSLLSGHTAHLHVTCVELRMRARAARI